MGKINEDGRVGWVQPHIYEAKVLVDHMIV